MALVPILANGLLVGKWGTDWRIVLGLAAVCSAGSFLLLFAYTLLRLRSGETVERALNEEPSPGERLKERMSGFVAMEYHALILNRTYVVFSAPDGLYGWKVRATVDATNPMFFAPYEQVLSDRDLLNNLKAVRRLASLKGGFFIPRGEIATAEFVDRQKWGMGLIPYSGRINLRLASGRTREFVLLGSVDGEAAQKGILFGGVSSFIKKPRSVQLPYVARYQKKLWLPLFLFWTALSAYFVWNHTETWTDGNWAFRTLTVLIVASPVFTLMEFAVQKLTFTETEICRTTRLGQVVLYPYSGIRSCTAERGAFLTLRFEDGRKLNIYTWIGNSGKILAVIKSKSPKEIGLPE